MSRTPLWARVLGVLGEVLITLGVLLALFVVWQLWWTDVVAEREHTAVVTALGWAQPVPDDAPRVAPDRDLAAAPVLPEPGHGETFAVLQVPRWGADHAAPISQGTSRRDILDVLGLGHYEGTAMPGQVGNFAVAGHRTTYGAPLNRVAELAAGDPLVVRTEDTWYVYRVTETRIVAPDQVEVIAPVPGAPGDTPSLASMTLTTCHPMYSARERFIVHAQLAQWLPTSEGVPAALDEIPEA